MQNKRDYEKEAEMQANLMRLQYNIDKAKLSDISNSPEGKLKIQMMEQQLDEARQQALYQRWLQSQPGAITNLGSSGGGGGGGSAVEDQKEKDRALLAKLDAEAGLANAAAASAETDRRYKRDFGGPHVDLPPEVPPVDPTTQGTGAVTSTNPDGTLPGGDTGMAFSSVPTGSPGAPAGISSFPSLAPSAPTAGTSSATPGVGPTVQESNAGKGSADPKVQQALQYIYSQMAGGK
jgi:hypothetical protein